MNTGSDGKPSGSSVWTGTREEGRGTPDDGPRLGSRAPESVRSRPALHLAWRAGVFVVGLAVVAGGVILLPLPGPGWLVIFGGMGLWATEFVWAQRVLHWAKRKVTEAAQRALDPRVRRRNLILTVLGLLIAGALVGLYVSSFGPRLPWRVGR